MYQPIAAAPPGQEAVEVDVLPVATAMIDRLVRHAEVISLRGDSFRMRGRDLGRVPPAETSSND
ncbi:hypothetical protein SMD11_0147 [Streptomyces albireticuli]|uniref:IstB-like ATP-binding domain-containing protein n=1 Tax=Streptomyces albireticuli TaxID=1940 RepID=A0A1Z2KUT0_9ACTN|nr:hypothetical protein SMD11_0147 [Streptomyces albireticuli]